VTPDQVERWLAASDDMRRRGNWDGAIDVLRRVLTEDPDHARAHAALALSLLGARRIQAAEIEARAGLGLDGGAPFCHFAMAAVLRAHRRLDDAWTHCLVSIEDDVVDPESLVLGASIQELRGHGDEARALLARALEADPERADTLTALARFELGQGQLDDATRHAREALESEPDNLDAHVVAGWVALRRGDVDDADGHARFALHADAADHDALQLWCAVKARRSLVLGAWWRWNAWTSQRSERSQLVVWIGSYVVAQVAMIIAGALDADGLQAGLGIAWLAFCAYTWIAPTFFRRMLQRDLGKVELSKDY
jgi:Flp pilus assembly protein TadD